jgi:selenocysteine lyase/cysteine desulfurase
MRSTLPTSHGFVAQPRPGVKPAINPLPPILKTPYVANFEFVGTVDNAPYLTIPRALKYRQDRYGGEDAIAAYLCRLARRAGEIVSKALGTEVMENEEGTLQNCAFTNFRLPIDAAAVLRLASSQSGGKRDIDALGGEIRDWIALSLVRDYGTFINFMFYGGAWWGRLSAQVYFEEADIVRAGEILKEVSRRVDNGEFLEKTSRL